MRDSGSGRTIHIFNIYNEVGTNTLSTLSEALGSLDPNAELAVLGDFNLHHLLWLTAHIRLGGLLSAEGLLTVIEES
jgi:hypothetical protein